MICGPTIPAGDIAFSLNNSMFIPRNSLLTEASNPNTIVVCHSDGAFPLWLNSENMTVSMNTSLAIHQMNVTDSAQLFITTPSEFSNGVYQCKSNEGNASMGIFIRQPGKLICDESLMSCVLCGGSKDGLEVLNQHACVCAFYRMCVVITTEEQCVSVLQHHT